MKRSYFLCGVQTQTTRLHQGDVLQPGRLSIGGPTERGGQAFPSGRESLGRHDGFNFANTSPQPSCAIVPHLGDPGGGLRR